jgi:hypothetical protein
MSLFPGGIGMSTIWQSGGRAPLLALPFLAACASAAGTANRVRYGPEDLARVRDSIEVAALERSEEPRVQIITPSILGADRFVESAIRVNRDAYVGVFAIDYDGRARVLFPELPSESGLVKAGGRLTLPKFFAGFGTARFALNPGSRYGLLQPMYGGRSGGLIYAIASDRPLQFQRLANDDDDWDEYEIERQTWNVSYNGVAYALGRVLSLTGQDFDTDFSGFTQTVRHPGYVFASFTPTACSQNALAVQEAEGRSAVYTNIRYEEIDGIQYARLSPVIPCGSGSRPVPFRPVPRDRTQTDSTQGDGSASAYRGSRAALRIAEGWDRNFSPERPLPRRGALGEGHDTAGRSRRPLVDRSLRLSPVAGTVTEGGVARRSDDDPLHEIARERAARRQTEARQRHEATPPRAAERRAPARTERAQDGGNANNPSSVTGERAGKPVKE